MSCVSFRRDARSRVVGCLVYTVAAPFVALFLALFLTLPFTFALEQLGARKDVSNALFPVVLAIMAVVIALWGVRDYRRRASITVEIEHDRVVVTVGGRSRTLAFAEVKAVRLVPAASDLACVLEPHEGRPLRFPPDIASLARVRAPLEPALVRPLALKIGERAAAGETVAVRERPMAAVLLIVRGIAELGLAGFFVVTLVSARHFFAVGRVGITHLRQGWLGLRGGLFVHDRGLGHYRNRNESPASWQSLEIVRADDAGLVVRADDGRYFIASPLADSYWPALLWIKSRLRGFDQQPFL